MSTEPESFDFIVTGAGSAVYAVAARLSESGKYRVLLLEAGDNDTSFWIHVPMGFSQLYANPRVDWMYESEPEAQLGGWRLYLPRGKVLGGTSSISGMFYSGATRQIMTNDGDAAFGAAAAVGTRGSACRDGHPPRAMHAVRPRIRSQASV